MASVKSMEFASFTLGVLGIIASLLVLGGPRPGPEVWSGIPSAQSCQQWLLASAQEEDFSSARLCLQWLRSLDDGFSDSVDEALGFPDLVLFTSVIHILANVCLLYGVYQSNSCLLVVFTLYYILTTMLGLIFALLLASYESILVAMCLMPMESSVILLYDNSLFLPLFIVVKAVLLFCIQMLLLKMDDIKKKAKPASDTQMQVDLVFVVPSDNQMQVDLVFVVPV